MYRANPNIPIWFCDPRMQLFYVCFLLGLLPFVPFKESFLSVPLANQDYLGYRYLYESRWYADWVQEVSIRIQNWITPLIVEHCRRRQILVAYWVLKNEAEFEQSRQVTYIVTPFALY